MKPLQIGLLIAAGALGGALVMKWQSTRNPNPAQVSAAVSAPVPTPAVAPVAEPAPAAEAVPEPPAEPARPSAFPDRSKAQAKPAPKAKSAPAVIARNQPSSARAVTEPAPPPSVPSAEQAAQPAPPPQPGPPARTAPTAIQEPVREPAAAVAPQAPPPSPEPNRVTVTAGTMVPIRLTDGLSTERNLPGDTFSATLDAPLIVDGFAIAERGARVEGKVVESVKAGKVSGTSSLAVVLTQITTSDGQRVRIETQTFTKKGDTSRRDDATKVGAGAGIGAVIGAIAGGGRGAGIGAAVGGAAGAGDVLLTRGKPATLATETRINFRLSAPVTITERAR
jgi:hypothetical protein